MGSRNLALLLEMLDTGLRVGEVTRLLCQERPCRLLAQLIGRDGDLKEECW
jgi:hypothetical protein